MKKSLRWLLTILATATLTACATSTQEALIIKKFDEANYHFAKGKYDFSQKEYQEILDKQPDSPFRIHALLGVADSHYMYGEYEMSTPMYQRFIELYPLDPRIDHALFYQGMSYFKDMQKMERDQTNTIAALEMFKLFVSRKPKHPASVEAREKIAFLIDRLAEKELYLVEFYYGIGSFISCIRRADELAKKYPDSRYIPEALLFKAKSYREEEAFEKAKKTFARVARDYPDTPSGMMAMQELGNL